MNESEFEAIAVSGGPEPLEMALEQMAIAITESQAALLGGRLRDLEAATRKQQQLCRYFQNLRVRDGRAEAVTNRNRSNILPERVIASAARVYVQNLVFAGILKRMRRSLEVLERQIEGSGFSYNHHRNSALEVNPAHGRKSRG